MHQLGIARRRLVQAGVQAGLAAASGASALAKPARRPNVVFVLADQWRAQAFGYTGDPNAETPNADALARESFNFSNAVSGLPVCSPYRASLMTGQYAVRNGIVVNDVELKPNSPTLGETFRQAGYATGYIGKWHLYGSPGGQAERRLQYIPETHRLGFDYWKVCECTHAYNRSLYYEGADATQRYWPGYDAIAQTEDACRFIGDRARRSDPYFLLLSLGPPHDPYGTAPEADRARYATRPIELRKNVPASVRDRAIENLRGYYSHIAAMDRCLGQLRAAVKQSGKEDDTIFVFTSDHGDMLQSQGMQLKQLPWDESLRVPFLVRYPKKLGERRREARSPIDVVDIFPTLAGLAGLKAPASIQGQDFSGVMTGKKKEAADPSALLNLPVSFSVVRRNGIAEYRGVRGTRYTFVRSINGPWLLYDNATDPYQMKNLIGNPQYRDVQAAQEQLLDRKLAAVGDDFLPGARYAERANAAHYREVTTTIGDSQSPWGDWRASWKR